MRRVPPGDVKVTEEVRGSSPLSSTYVMSRDGSYLSVSANGRVRDHTRPARASTRHHACLDGAASRQWQYTKCAGRGTISDVGLALGSNRLRAVQLAVGLLLLVVIFAVGKRFANDMPNLAAGTMPEDEFDHRYVEQPWLVQPDIVPGVLYLFLAPLQLAYRIRSRH